MRIQFLIVGLALSAFSAAASAQFNFNLNRLIDTAKNVGQAGTEINEQQEAEIGKEYAALLVGAAPLLDNAEVQRYLNRVGRWLSLNSERPDLNWQFGVLAHEITHVVKKHHLAAIRKAAGMQAGANILAEFAAQGRRNTLVTDRLIKGFKEVMLRGLDKDDEFEADRMGVVIAARAGYDPYGLPAVLQMLQGMNAQDSGVALLFATHPDPNTRLDTLERVIGTRLDRYAVQPQAVERFARTVQGPQAGSATSQQK